MKKIMAVEFQSRIKRFQQNLRAAGLDAALVHSNEADLANVRYLTEYWPAFEATAVFVPARGKPVLLIGPESLTYAQRRSVVPDILKMVEYRESAEPQYPGIPVASYRDVVQRAMPGRKLKKLGIVAWSITTLPVWMRLQNDLPGVKFVKADDTLSTLRIITMVTTAPTTHAQVHGHDQWRGL